MYIRFSSLYGSNIKDQIAAGIAQSLLQTRQDPSSSTATGSMAGGWGG